MTKQTKALLLPILLLITALSPAAAVAADKDPTVKLEVNSESVKMRALFKKHIIDQVKWRGSDDLLKTSGKSNYKMIVKIKQADTEPAGRRWGPFGYKRTYRSSIEVTVELVNGTGEQLWTWDGYGEHKTLEKTIKSVAKQLAKAMDAEGLLKKSFYKAE